MLDQAAIQCGECRREVDEFTAIAEKWGYWSDGVGELVPFCPECARREFHSTLVLPGHRLTLGIAPPVVRVLVGNGQCTYAFPAPPWWAERKRGGKMKGKLAGMVSLGAAVLAAGFLAAFGFAAPNAGGGPPNQGDPDKVTSVLSGYVCSGTIIWRDKVDGDGQAKTVNITETLPIVEVRVKSGSKAALVSAVFSGNFLSATVTISQGVSNYAWSVCQPGDTTTTDTTTTVTTTT